VPLLPELQQFFHLVEPPLMLVVEAVVIVVILGSRDQLFEDLFSIFRQCEFFHLEGLLKDLSGRIRFRFQGRQTYPAPGRGSRREF
jgi:hypothetical protein